MLLLLLLLLWGDYFEVMTLKAKVNFFWPRSTSLFFSSLFSHPNFPSGWDPSLPDQISVRGGIRCFQTKFLFGVGSSLLELPVKLKVQIESLSSFFSFEFITMLSMPQVFEQSLFLFLLCRGRQWCFSGLSPLCTLCIGHCQRYTVRESQPQTLTKTDGTEMEAGLE